MSQFATSRCGLFNSVSPSSPSPKKRPALQYNPVNILRQGSPGGALGGPFCALTAFPFGEGRDGAFWECLGGFLTHPIHPRFRIPFCCAFLQFCPEFNRTLPGNISHTKFAFIPSAKRK